MRMCNESNSGTSERNLGVSQLRKKNSGQEGEMKNVNKNDETH